MISVEMLHQLLRYDPETGKLFWKTRPPEMFKNQHYCSVWNSNNAGKEALCYRRPCGHLCGTLLGKTALAHHVVWAMLHGDWPIQGIDHRDLNPANNRPSNLRQATASQNQFNRPARGGTSKFKGVVLRGAKWGARISANGVHYWLGFHPTEIDAAQAYDKSAARLHGEFAFLNFPEGTST